MLSSLVKFSLNFTVFPKNGAYLRDEFQVSLKIIESLFLELREKIARFN